MGKVVLMLSISLDGYFEGPNREIDWHLVDEELHTYINGTMRDVGAFLEGRVTWELMADYWPTADQDPASPAPIKEFAAIWRDTPKYLFSRTRDHAEWNTTIVREVDPAHIEELKRTHGELWIGSENLASELWRHDLIDELRIYIHPVMIGAGKTPFTAGVRVSLELVDNRRFTNGVVMMQYRRVSRVS